MVLLFVIPICCLVLLPVVSWGSILDDICQVDTETPIDISQIVEEAEATGMPVSTLNRLLVKGYVDKPSTKELSNLLCVIIEAEEDGLTPDLLFTKVDEGLAKKATLVQISSVIKAKVDDMKFAQNLLNNGAEPQPEDTRVERLAKALSAGLTRPELTFIFIQKAPENMKVVAAEIKTYGKAIAFDPQLLDLIIETGISEQSLSEDWSYLIKVISLARKKNISDAQIAQKAVYSLTEKLPLSHLSACLGLKPIPEYE